MNGKLLTVASLLLVCVAVLVAPAMAGQTNVSVDYQANVTATVPTVAVPQVACYRPVPLQLNTLALLPTQSSFVATESFVDGPTRREVRKAERTAKRAAKAAANLQSTVTTVSTAQTTAQVGVVATSVPLAAAVPLPGPVINGQVAVESQSLGMEAH